MVDRKLLKNPNGLILGTPGSGKSFSAKREIANCFLLTSDDVIICDPEAEYAPLVERLHGQVIKISPTSTNYINPMDLNLDYSDDESPLSLKSDFILSLCELIVGGKDGLQPVQKTIIDRCVRLVYQDYLNDPRPENMPILEDLYDLLRAQDEKEAQYIATALEIYVTGSLNVFNHRSKRGHQQPHRLLRHQGIGQTAQENRDAGCSGSGLETVSPSTGRPTSPPAYYIDEIAPAAERGTDRRLHGGDLESGSESGAAFPRASHRT